MGLREQRCPMFFAAPGSVALGSVVSGRTAPGSALPGSQPGNSPGNRRESRRERHRENRGKELRRGSALPWSAAPGSVAPGSAAGAFSCAVLSDGERRPRRGCLLPHPARRKPLFSAQRISPRPAQRNSAPRSESPSGAQQKHAPRTTKNSARHATKTARILRVTKTRPAAQVFPCGRGGFPEPVLDLVQIEVVLVLSGFLRLGGFVHHVAGGVAVQKRRAYLFLQRVEHLGVFL